MFKVGQKVICKVYGEGVVTEINDMHIYPIGVEFLNGEWECYTSDGELPSYGFYDIEHSLTVIEE